MTAPPKTFSARLNPTGRRMMRAGLLFAALAVPGWLGCKGCSCNQHHGEMPATSQARVDDMTSHLPSDTDMALVAGNLATMRSTLQKVKTRMGDILPTVNLLQQQVRTELGLDILSGQSWKQAGIAPDGGLVLALVDEHPILLTYVKNHQAFERVFADHARKIFHIKGAPKVQTVDGHSIKVLRKSAHDQIAWTYVGSMAIVGFPALHHQDTSNGPDMPHEIATLAGKLDMPLKNADRFQRVRQELTANYPLLGYLNPAHYLQTHAKQQKSAHLSALQSAAIQWAKKNVDAIGIGLKSAPNQVKLRAYFAVDRDLLAKIKGMRTPPQKADWNGFATSKVMIGGRLSVNFQKFWKLYLQSLPAAQRKYLSAQLQKEGQGLNIDVQKDILDHLTGNMALFFYGVDMGKLMKHASKSNPLSAMSAVGAMIAMQFDNSANLQAVIKKITIAGHGLVAERPVNDRSGKPVKNVQVVALRNMTKTPGSLYVKGNMLTFATSAFSEASVYEYLTGKRPGTKLSASKNLPLGKRFATDPKFTGVYLNFVRASRQFGLTIPIAMVQKVLSELQEAMLSLNVTKDGGFATLTIDLTPKAPAAKTSKN